MSYKTSYFVLEIDACPDCGGTGGWDSIHCFDVRHPCKTCQGKGEIETRVPLEKALHEIQRDDS